MDIYHIWCDLKPGVRDLDFVAAAKDYFDQLKKDGSLQAFRITRRKLGLAPKELGDFHIMLEFASLADLDTAFSTVASRAEPVESFHHAVNSKVGSLTFGLYRDFPDEVRQEGEEKF
jgi:hypothetical protein